MKKTDFLKHLETLLEVDSESLTGEEQLSSLEGWDSLTLTQFIILVDEQFGITVPASRISEARTVNDLLLLLGSHITQ